jgi:hypothetical protein
MENVYNAVEAEKQHETLNKLKELLQTLNVIEEELDIWYEHLNEDFMYDEEVINFCNSTLIPTITDYTHWLSKIHSTAKNSLIKQSLKQEVIDNTNEMCENIYEKVNQNIRELPLPNETAIKMIYAAKNLKNYKECESQ